MRSGATARDGRIPVRQLGAAAVAAAVAADVVDILILEFRTSCWFIDSIHLNALLKYVGKSLALEYMNV